MIELNIRVRQTLTLFKQSDVKIEEAEGTYEVELHKKMKPYERRITFFRVLITVLCLCYLSYSLFTIMLFEYKQKQDPKDARAA